MSDQRATKEALHSAIQASSSGDAVLEGAVLTRYVLIGEWLDGSGVLVMSRLSGTRDGSDLRTWEANGLLVTALMQGVPK